MNTYTFYITLYVLAALGAIFTGLTIAVSLRFTKKINRSANRLPAPALVVAVLLLAWLSGIDITPGAYFSRQIKPQLHV